VWVALESCWVGALRIIGQVGLGLGRELANRLGLEKRLGLMLRHGQTLQKQLRLRNRLGLNALGLLNRRRRGLKDPSRWAWLGHWLSYLDPVRESSVELFVGRLQDRVNVGVFSSRQRNRGRYHGFIRRVGRVGLADQTIEIVPRNQRDILGL
jgi:hypothetical protein